MFPQVLQPNLADPGSKPLSDEERAIAVNSEWTDCARLGYPLLRGAGLRLLDQGVNHLDASDVFDGIEATIYHDAGHFVPLGNELLAERVAEGFLEVAFRP